MAKLTKDKLESILNSRLSLKDPVYDLERYDNRLFGSIISPTFKGKRDHKRQEMIWDALEAELGPKAAAMVGMLLAYTPEEWHFGEEPRATPRRRKKVG